MKNMQRVVVEQEFSPFYARRLALKMGLQGNLIESVSEIIQKMYHLFVQKDLDLVEINPLGISFTGEVMALDGKINANDHALGRHSELVTLGATRADGETNSQISTSQLTELNWTDGEGNIGIVCNDTCLAAATLDLVYQANGKPASCLIVDGYASWDLQSVSSPIQQQQNALEHIITKADDIKVVLVNILSSSAASEEVAEVITNYLLSQVNETPMVGAVEWSVRPTGATSSSQRERSNGTVAANRRSASLTQLPHFVIRIVGENFDSVKEGLAGISVHWMDNLEEAVAKAISLTKSAVEQT
jgi:succinyl-CoA synthetase beta subunit